MQQRRSRSLSDNNEYEDNENTSTTTERDALVLVGTLYSLSRDFVRFEHEQQQQHSSASSSSSFSQRHPQQHHTGFGNSSNAKSSVTSSSSSSDAFHVVHTLHPLDFPLQVRDRMADHLRQLQAQAVVGRTIIAPKLQWYYCPKVVGVEPRQDTQSSGSSLKIPSCINLEGYCTSMEEEEEDWGYDDDDDDDDDDDNGNIQEERLNGSNDMDDEEGGDENDYSIDAGGTVEDADMLASRFPWLRISDCHHPTHDDSTVRRRRRQPAAEVAMSARQWKFQKQYRREKRRLHVLSAHVASLPQGTLSGYLLKRSSRDFHVWRRVHCVLTDDYLWFVSRRYANKSGLAFAKHGRVRLTRALLLEPSADYAPLYRTPYAFEMVATDGTSHIFRASNRSVQRQWIQAISDRILQSYENSLLENAQLLVNDACIAQARRLDHSMDELWEQLPQQQSYSCAYRCMGNTGTDPIGMQSKPLAKVLRWTLKVTDFRHFCRHVRSTLPAKSPVVVVTSPSSTRKPPPPPPPPSALLAREVSGDRVVRVSDPLIRSMILACWQQATVLLQEATDVGQFLLSRTSQPHRNLETLLRHVEFVLTGRHRPVRATSGNSVASLSSAGGGGGDETSHHDRNEPPPLDLFDALVKELQGLAVSMR